MPGLDIYPKVKSQSKNVIRHLILDKGKYKLDQVLKSVVGICLFQENRFLALQPIFYIAGMSKLI